MIDTIKVDIARRARVLGFRFDDNEIIDTISYGLRVIFLRSIKATRQIEQPDGTLIDEEFNDPIIWLEYPPVGLTTCEADQDRQVLRYSIPLPRLVIRCPELIQVVPIDQPASALS